MGDNVNITNCPDSASDSNIIRCMDASYTSDSDCSSSSDTDYCSSETDRPTSSEEPDKSKSGISINVTPIGKTGSLSLVILSYIAKYKLSGSASVDLLDLLKLIAPKDNILQSLTLNGIKETLGDCIVNIHDYCGKCFSIFPKDESVS